MAAAVLPAGHREKFKDHHEVDLAYSVAGLGRFRCNAFQQRGTIGMIFRVIPMRVATIDDLLLPQGPEEDRRGRARPGLVTGTTGSGKSTTLAALIDEINSTPHRAHHDDRGPDRVPASGQPLDHQPARDRRRHQLVRAGAAQRAAPGSRRHPGRRDARPRDDPDGAAGRRDRSPGVLHAAHARRHRDDQPHHRRVPAAPAEAGSHPARERAQGGDLAAPDPAGPTARDACRPSRS